MFTELEIDYCQRKRDAVSSFAARFAAKEATMKALGTGVRGVSWKDIEVTRQRSGAPGIQLYGRAEKRAANLGITEISISLSHSREYAVAFVIASHK